MKSKKDGNKNLNYARSANKVNKNSCQFGSKVVFLLQLKPKVIMTTDEYLQKLKQFKLKHADEYGIERIGIFGSVARGEQAEDSDIDIYYEGKSLGLKSLVSFPTELEKAFGRPVDVVRKHNNLRPSFLQRILKEVVYV